MRAADWGIATATYCMSVVVRRRLNVGVNICATQTLHTLLIPNDDLKEKKEILDKSAYHSSICRTGPHCRLSSQWRPDWLIIVINDVL